jgi:tight adherence protein B
MKWLIVAAGTYGMYLLLTAWGFAWTGIGPGPRRARVRRTRPTLRQRLDAAGLSNVSQAEFLISSGLLALVAAVMALAVFGGILPALCLGVFAATFPAAAYRHRGIRRRQQAEESWPAMIEEIRVLCGSAGRSVPQALFDVGRRSAPELAVAFEEAHREWLLRTDLEAALALLRSRLDSPTADSVAETLLVAHELGGVDLERRLAELAEDRRNDAQARKDARARQAGVRFARRFVILVPAGMAVAGMSLGNGREAFRSGSGQLLAVAAIVMVGACWAWSARLLRLPQQQRVFR